MMTPGAERYARVQQLFDAAADLPPSARTAFLDAECGDDASIRHEVESLLDSDACSDSFGEEPVFEVPRDLFNEAVEDHVAGQHFGPYEVIREIGRGGLGAVYLAIRSDGEYRKEVALKLIRRGLDTDDILRRFRNERQILAQLDHPNIARLIDGGTTDNGLPYFVMEYVKGEPITAYCDTYKLSTKQRLELFRKVCAAVTYAHQNLVIHRDLKPSNILVTSDGEAKLLDFGIAKLVAADDDLLLTQTAPGQRAMTPDYASPEQIKGERITTASDVYSLGVLLYELLTGTKPYRLNTRTTEELSRAITDQEPQRPSAAAAPDRAALDGDLDNIVLMAMRKEPARRYSSAAALAEDIRRYQGGLTVSARPSTFRYRAGKFIRRHSAGVAAAALVLLAIVAGLIATLWQAGVARAAQARAEKRFNDVRTLANSFLFEFSPKIENLPGSMPARQLLVTRALEYLDSLSQEAAGDLQLQSELAKAYEKVGDVQGNPQTANIGDLDGALESYNKAQAIRRRLLEAQPNNAEKQADLAGNLEVAANINLNGGEFDKAGASFTEALQLRERVVAQTPRDFAARANLGRALRTSGYVPFYSSENDKAMEFYRRSMAVFAELSAEAPDDALVNMGHANAYLDIGESYGFLEQQAQAEEYLQKGLDMLAALYEKHPNDVRVRRAFFVANMKRGENHRDSENLESSLAKYQYAWELAQKALQDDPGSFQARRDVVMVNKGLAVTQKQAGQFKESVASFSRAIQVSEQLRREDPSNILISYDIGGGQYEMAELYLVLNDYPSALAAAENSQANCGAVLAKNPAHTQSMRVTAQAKSLAGNVYAALAERDNQMDSWRKALENYRASREIYGAFKADGKL
ncbi:MAG: protein kinase, partial [Chthoniobacterales bacterium]|nr:protein kinase [Chthoniobacterales bacterium]